MTHPTPTEAQVLLILGELRGAVEGINTQLSTLSSASDSRIKQLEVALSSVSSRLSTLENIKVRVGGIAIGIGFMSGVAGYNLPLILKFLSGG